jgi:uncharacterized delta-60 repeat protein
VGNTGYTESDILVFVNYQIETGTTSNTPLSQVKEWVLSGLSENYLPLSGGTVSGDTIFQSGLTATTISATTYLNLPDVEPSKKIVLKKMYLGNKNVNDTTKLGVRAFISNTLVNNLDRLTNVPSQYTGSFLDYYFTVNDGVERKKILYKREIGSDYFTATTVFDMVDYIVDTYVDINVNFYCELWVFLDKDFNEIKQLKLVNPLFNSLHPRKLNMTKSYLGITEFVRKTNDLAYDYFDNTITSNFIGLSDVYYDPATSEDIPKKLYDIVNTSGFYGSLSGFAQTVINVGSWDKDVRNVVNNSVYVETLQNFYTKFIVPTNKYNFTNVNLQKLNNFYGDIFYDNVSGSPLVFSANSNTDVYPSPYFLQLIDTYKIYPSGQFGYIFYSADDEENTALNNLDYIVGHYNNLKYINRTTRPFGSYIQVIPGINENYSLNVKISGDPDQNLCNSFIDDLFDNRLVLNNPNVKLSNSNWQNIKNFNKGEFYNSVLTGQTEFNFLLQSTDVKMEELSNNYQFTSSTFIQKIYNAGAFSVYNDNSGSFSQFGVNSLSGNGLFNQSFNSGGPGLDTRGFSIVQQSDGKIIVVGEIIQYLESATTIDMGGIVRLNLDGTFDMSFVNGSGYGFNGEVFDVDIQTDGKIIVGGAFSTYSDNTGSYTSNGIARLNSDGTFDTTFNNGGTGFDNYVSSVKIQSDGKILCGGLFTVYNDINSNWNTNYMIRLNTDGTADLDFIGDNYGFNGDVRSISIQNDGKILVGGGFTSYSDSATTFDVNFLCRLESNGDFDTSFVNSISYGFNDTVETLAIQSNGKILVGGPFDTYIDGTGSYYSSFIARLNSNGTYDTSFLDGVGTYGFFGDKSVSDIKIQNDGKILVGGAYDLYEDETGSYNMMGISRLNSDGTFDTSFNSGATGFTNGRVYGILLTEQTVINKISVDAIYKGHSFRPFIYPLNLTQIFFDVPTSYLYDGTNLIPSDNSSNNIFEFVGSAITNKKLSLIVYYKKLDSYDLFVEDIVLAQPRDLIGATENNVITLMLNNLEKIFTTNLGNNVKSRQIKPNNLEVYLGILDVATNKVNTIPNYKIIVDNYGGNLIFRLVKGGLNKN